MLDKFMDWVEGPMNVMMIGMIIFILIAFFVGIPLGIWALINDYNKPTFSLQKDAWHCTNAHLETTMIMVGKVLVPSHTNICDQWSRN